MNVLKLLHCFWKHPISRTQFIAVNYYIQYERVNHIANRIFQDFGQFRYVLKHEDICDQEIYQALYNNLSTIPNIQQFYITTQERVLFDQSEEETRALFSNMAFGYNFRLLNINTIDNLIGQLETRVYFTDVNNIINQTSILTAIPFALNLNLNGTVPTLVRANFLNSQQVDQILDRENGIDLSRFHQ